MFRSLKVYKDERVDLEKLIAEIIEFGYKKQSKVLQIGDFARRGEVIDIFPYNFELPIRIQLDFDTVNSISSFDPINEDLLWQHKLVIILPVKKIESFPRYIGFSEEVPLTNFLDINPGDYVVHLEHGIGRFLGFERVKNQNKYTDCLVIEYDRQEKLLVPVDYAHLVQKYIAFGIKKPKLYRLGSKEWLRDKERVKKAVSKLAWELLSLQALRMSIKGFKYSEDNDWQKAFEESFPYEETPDQKKAIEEVKSDMQSYKPMDRLLCGDVGYGKTEVAMRAAFKATQDFKQVAFLVPTTILAEQHYYNFSQRIKDFPIRIEMLSRFKTKKEQEEIIKGIKEGRVDIVIGTHRLLQDDIEFKDLGLVIIDEEHRFGVKAKEKLKKLRLFCDVLSLTATPIPRTLYMSLIGVKDMSVINTPPLNRLPIKTYVVEYNENLIREAILKEIERKGQVYFVHNRIEDIERQKDKIVKMLPNSIRWAVAHGRTEPHLLEKIMYEFFKGEIDVLFCTQIIQSGIDIPNANTLIVNNADTFGLADLHQLRGRIGRFNRSAYAYFLIPKGKILSTQAKKRLEAIQKYSHLGAGFSIALEDLEIRGAGNLLGYQQHGFIATVGFDLYCRLLNIAINELKNKIGGYNAQ